MTDKDATKRMWVVGTEDDHYFVPKGVCETEELANEYASQEYQLAVKRWDMWDGIREVVLITEEMVAARREPYEAARAKAEAEWKAGESKRRKERIAALPKKIGELTAELYALQQEEKNENV